MDKNQQEKNEVPTNPGPNTALTDRRVRNIRLIQRIILLLAAATLVLGIYYFREDIYDSYTKIRTQQQLAQQREDTVYSKIAFEPDSNNTYALFGRLSYL